MSEEKQYEKTFDNDPERTLITLEQLSQTIQVMTSVVNKLRQHLSEQLKSQIEQQKQMTIEEKPSSCEKEEAEQAQLLDSKQQCRTDQRQHKRESLVIEIRQQKNEQVRKNTKTLH